MDRSMEMDPMEEGSSLDSLISSFNDRVADLKDLTIARNLSPAIAIPDLAGVDFTLSMIETKIQDIKDSFKGEREAIRKGKKFIELSKRQQNKLEHMATHFPSGMNKSTCLSYEPNSENYSYYTPVRSMQDISEFDLSKSHLEMIAHSVKEKKGHNPAPRWFITQKEFDALSSYMRGRLQLDKVNIAINELASCANITAQLIAKPKKKMSDEAWKKVLEIKEVARSENVKGKHFLLECDVKGPGLKLDNTGKATLTVLRHLGRIQECRIGHHRVFTLMTPTF
ncbi:hypothetical protein ZOSMA_85G00660 [Zostera marina]|uniref:SKA complex subunit 1 homolog n=1 Tax=Zostera marina TaxID=29655 RepID=A0A0K9NL46_ZOSMR|nr:hypothetical protein ZOSMA_85G00660 [Zostera marina]